MMDKGEGLRFYQNIKKHEDDSLKEYATYNTLGVYHQLSSRFELKHDMLSGDEGVKVKSMRVNPNLNLDNTPLLHVDPFQIYA
jgi:hypothetical protein